MKASFERFLAVRRFGATPTRRPTPIWSDSDDDVTELDDVSVETDEDGDGVLVTFSDEVAHEHVDLVEECLDRCRAFPGVEDAHWQDRELIVLRGSQIDQRRLQYELLSSVRAALASRSVDDNMDDG